MFGLGIDTKMIHHVVNYDFPISMVDYLHRVGRVGRVGQNLSGAKGGKYLVFLSSRSVKMSDSSAFSVCILFEKSVFIFQFLNIKMHNYASFDIIVHFIHKKYTN